MQRQRRGGRCTHAVRVGDTARARGDEERYRHRWKMVPAVLLLWLVMARKKLAGVVREINQTTQASTVVPLPAVGWMLKRRADRSETNVNVRDRKAVLFAR